MNEKYPRYKNLVALRQYKLKVPPQKNCSIGGRCQPLARYVKFVSVIIRCTNLELASTCNRQVKNPLPLSEFIQPGFI